jgi:hypothetical protein
VVHGPRKHQHRRKMAPHVHYTQRNATQRTATQHTLAAVRERCGGWQHEDDDEGTDLIRCGW